MTSQNRKIILVVDDDQHILSFVTECLAEMGQKVFSAASGEEAVKIINSQERGMDLLLSDVVMPGMDGIELAKALTGYTPTAKIIFMSGFMQPALPSGNTAKYGRGFIQKPFSKKTLLNHVKKALTELPQEASK